MSAVGDPVTVFRAGEMPLAGAITEIGLATVCIRFGIVTAWFHDLDAAVADRAGRMMGDPNKLAHYEKR